MRKTICIEGSHPVNGRLLLHGSVKWDGDLPLVWNFLHHDINGVLGKASNIVREGDGRITAEIEFNDSERAQAAKTTLEDGDVACTIWANEVEEDVTKNPYEVSSCKLREVSLVMADSVPWRRND